MSDLEQQYKQLFNDSIDVKLEDNDWLRLENELKRKEFYAFSFYRFNLYYALGIIFSFSASIYSLIDHHIYHKHGLDKIVSTFENPDHFVKKSILVHDTVFVEVAPSNLEKQSVKLKMIGNHQKKMTSISLKAQKTVDQKLMSDIKTHQDEITDKNSESELFISKKIEPELKEEISAQTKSIVVHHRDTIVELDTIKVSRRKLKKMNGG